MIAMLSSRLRSVENTLNTLRYVGRVKEPTPLEEGRHSQQVAAISVNKVSSSMDDLIQTLEVQNESSEDVIQYHEAMEDLIEMYDEFILLLYIYIILESGTK